MSHEFSPKGIEPTQTAPGTSTEPSGEKSGYDGRRGGVWDVFPQYRNEFWDMRVMLGEIRSGAREMDDLLDYLDAHPEFDRIASTEIPALEHKSPLSYIRAEIESEAAVKRKTKPTKVAA